MRQSRDVRTRMPRCRQTEITPAWTSLRSPFEVGRGRVLFREPPSLREGLGMSLIVVAVGILVWASI